MAEANYTKFGVKTHESTLCTTHCGTAVQLVDACLATDDELQRTSEKAGRGLRLDRLGNEASGTRTHHIVECEGADRYRVLVFFDEEECGRRMDFAGAASKARADGAFQAFKRGLLP